MLRLYNGSIFQVYLDQEDTMIKRFAFFSALVIGLMVLGGLLPSARRAEAAVQPQPFRSLPALSPERVEAFFDAYLNRQLAEEQVVGAAVVVVQGADTLFTRGYGYADLDQRIAVDAAETLFFIGSDGKLLIWTAVMQLVEQGKLDLNADVNTYLDFSIPIAWEQPVTLHHLMTHTAGFEEELNSLFVLGPEDILPLREHLLRFMPQRVYPPGRVSAYSNYGTALAGYIIERISGQPIETYLRQQILHPLGIDGALVGNALPQDDGKLSTGYIQRGTGFQAVDFEWTAAPPCAPVRLSAVDAGRFMLAHLNRGCLEGGCILRPETMERMHSRQFAHHPGMDGWTYGFMDAEMNGQRVLWHMGESPTFKTVLALLPEQDLGVLVSYNTPPAELRSVLFRFMDEFFPVERPALPAGPLPGWQERAARFNGVYVSARSAHSTSQILARYQAAVPVSAGPQGLPFGAWKFSEVEPGLFQQAGGDRKLAFARDESGRRWLFMGPLSYFRLEWYETPLFLAAAIGGSLLVFISAWAGWPAAALRKRRAGAAPHPLEQGLAAGLGLFQAGLLAWMGLLLLNFGVDYVYPQQSAALVGRLAWATLPWALLVLALAGRAWLGRRWSLFWRVHYSLLGAAGALFTGLFWFFKLLA
jgi:CubicO group peptidase (beta-lactamase class C family)